MDVYFGCACFTCVYFVVKLVLIMLETQKDKKVYLDNIVNSRDLGQHRTNNGDSFILEHRIPYGSKCNIEYIYKEININLVNNQSHVVVTAYDSKDNNRFRCKDASFIHASTLNGPTMRINFMKLMELQRTVQNFGLDSLKNSNAFVVFGKWINSFKNTQDHKRFVKKIRYVDSYLCDDEVLYFGVEKIHDMYIYNSISAEPEDIANHKYNIAKYIDPVILLGVLSIFFFNLML